MKTSRREFVAGMAGLLGLPGAETSTEVRYPWSERADELRDAEGHYADFAAFSEWVAEHDREFDQMAVTDQVAVYHICCRAVEQAKQEGAR